MLHPSEKEWTIMAFIAGADNLSPAARDGLLQMKQVGSTKHFDLIAQFDTGNEGPTKRYHLKPIGRTESEKIDEARKVFDDLDQDSLSNLLDPFKKLLKEEESENGISRAFESMQRLKVKIGDKNRPLGLLFESLLVGPQVKQCFLDNLKDRSKRKRLASDPFFLIPFLFDCLFERDRCDDGPRFTSTGDPAVLRDFLEWGIESYPSRHKMVVIKGHGDGLSVAWDATPRSGREDKDLDRLRAVELREAFSIPKKDQLASFQFFDIVGFNACLMGMIEVYHKLRNYVGIGIASEGNTPNLSWPFLKILGELQKQPSMTPRALAQTILDEYMKEEEESRFEEKCLANSVVKNKGECTIDLSICNLSRVQEVVSHLGNLTESLKRLLSERQRNPIEAQKLVKARNKSQSYFNDDYVDLSSFCEELQHQFATQNMVVEACKKVIESVDSMVLDHRHLKRAPNSHGLSIYFPEKDFPRSYSRSLRIKEIDWVDFLHSYLRFKKECTITRVDSAANTVTVKMAADSNQKEVTLTVVSKSIDPKNDTKITVGGKPGKLTDLKVHQKAIVEHDGNIATSFECEFAAGKRASA